MANYEVLEPGGHSALVDGLKDYADRAGGTGAEQLADGSVNMDKLDDDVLDELDSKAYADGYYAQLTAGAADNLTARGDAVNAEYLYRTAGGTADIESGQATIKSIHGNTLVWNQLARLPFSGSQTVSGINFTPTGDGAMTLVGTSTAVVYKQVFDSSGTVYQSVAGHKYLVKTVGSGTGFDSVRVYNDSGGVDTLVAGQNVPAIGTATAVKNFYVRVPADKTLDCTVIVQLFDLTAMFGAGNEPSTVAEFEALFPLPYYEYDAGSLLSVNMEGIETVGFNQWDEEWELGLIDDSTGEPTAGSNSIRSKNFISVFPGTTYHFKITDGFNTKPYLYDAAKNYIGRFERYIDNGQTFTIPTNCRYIKIALATTYGTTYKGDICINLSWSGRRNGEYESFWSSQRLIDVATYFPDGMRSAGTVRDELTSTEAIQRVGVVDLGTLTWIQYNTSNYPNVWYVNLPLIALSTQQIKTNADMEHASSWVLLRNNTSTDILWFVSSTESRLYISSSLFGEMSGTGMQSYFAGKTVHYELATPIVTPIDPVLNLSYKVDDWGTEEIVTTGGDVPQSAPPTLEVAYGLNAVDFIRRAPTQYISHDSHDNFVDALEAELGVTVTEAFDDTDNAYEYSIAPTDGMTLAQAKENLRGLLDLVQGTIGSVTDWSEIAEMASHGSSFLVGTQFQSTYKSAADGTEYEMSWDVMHFETATVKGGSSVAGVYLESHYALPFATMFDQIEAFYAVPSGGLAAGTYSVTFGNTSAWEQVPANSTYSFTLANSYSQGAQLCFNRSIYNYAPDTCSVQAFATQGATTASETVAVSAGSAGTSLGTIGTAQVTDSSDLNHLHRIGLGSNRWMTSALRQWLNTDADGGTWWVPQTKWDRPPSYANYDGFLKGLDPDLVSAMREVRVVTAQNYSADGGTAAAPVTDVTYDKVFLPSWEQQYLAVSQSYGGSAGLEGSAWDYWKLAAGTASPRPASTSDNASTYTTAYVRYGMENHATARSSWLRSAYRPGGTYAAHASSSGRCGGHYASGGLFAAPACFIG